MSGSEETQVHVVRHGEVRNPDGVLYGRLPDFHLTERGQAMARRVAAHLAGEPVTHLRTSPLERARETMAPIAAEFAEVPVVADDRLIEADSLLEGQVFGRTNKALLDPRNWWLFRNPLRPSWGEPYLDIATRMHAAICDAARAAGAGKAAVVVSHQSPIWNLRCCVEGRRLAQLPTARRCSLASVTTFTFLAGRIIDVSYAEPAKDLLGADGNRAFSSGS